MKVKILRLVLLGADNKSFILLAVGKEVRFIGSTMFIDGLSFEEYKDENGYEDYKIIDIGRIEEVVIGTIIEKG